LSTAGADLFARVAFRLLEIRVLDRKSGEQKFDTEMMRVDLPAETDNPMYAVGERIPVEKLSSGQYTVEVDALSMGGAQVKRTADFDLQ